MNKVRKLKAEEIECRIAQCFDGKCTALLYKTARVDRLILDETYEGLWQNDFKVIDGKMYGGIGIYNTDLKEWMWRWDCGTESLSEAEKGQASDCFKRAGFKWGIGIELYSAPQIWLNIPTKRNEKGKFEPIDKYCKYTVSEISYNESGNISDLKIIDSKGNEVFSTKKRYTKQAAPETNKDFDIIAGLDGISDMKNLELYYFENKEKAADIKAFNAAVIRRKEYLKRTKNG